MIKSLVLARLGRFPEAMAQVEQFLSDKPDTVWELLLAQVTLLAGDRGKAEEILARRDASGTGVAAFLAAVIFGALGELDKGFAELERARDLRFAILATAKINPSFDPFRSDPRWEPFVKSMNFGV